MPYFYVKVRKNIDICNFLNGYYCHFYGVRGLFQCPLKRGGLVCPLLEGPRKVFWMSCKTLSKSCNSLSIIFFRKQANCLSLFRGDGRGVRKCSTFVLITDPLYLPLKRGGPVCPLLEGPRNVLLKYCKILSINLFRKQANCLSLFRGDGRGVR